MIRTSKYLTEAVTGNSENAVTEGEIWYNLFHLALHHCFVAPLLRRFVASLLHPLSLWHCCLRGAENAEEWIAKKVCLASQTTDAELGLPRVEVVGDGGLTLTPAIRPIRNGYGYGYRLFIIYYLLFIM